MSRTVFYCRCGARLEGSSARLSHRCGVGTGQPQGVPDAIHSCDGRCGKAHGHTRIALDTDALVEAEGAAPSVSPLQENQLASATSPQLSDREVVQRFIDLARPHFPDSVLGFGLVDVGDLTPAELRGIAAALRAFRLAELRERSETGRGE